MGMKNESNSINIASDDFSIISIETKSINTADDENKTNTNKIIALQDEKDRASDSFSIVNGVNDSFKVDYLMDENLNLEADSEEGSTTSDYDAAEDRLYL